MDNTLVKFGTLDSKIQNILREAVEARDFSYSPYSNFKVGACLLCDDGTTFRGCNVENLSYGLSICAERTALVKAVSEGRKKFVAIAVIAYQEKAFTPPCGACREFMSEFGDMEIYIAKPNLSEVLVTNLKALFPFQFVRNKDFTF